MKLHNPLCLLVGPSVLPSIPVSFFGGFWAAAPKETKSCRIQGESVRPVRTYVRPYVRTSVPPPVARQRLAQAYQSHSSLSRPASERPESASERPGSASERPESVSEGPESASEGPQGGGTDGWTYVRTDAQITPVFYRTLSPPVPSRAAALLT